VMRAAVERLRFDRPDIIIIAHIAPESSRGRGG